MYVNFGNMMFMLCNVWLCNIKHCSMKVPLTANMATAIGHIEQKLLKNSRFFNDANDNKQDDDVSQFYRLYDFSVDVPGCCSIYLNAVFC